MGRCTVNEGGVLEIEGAQAVKGAQRKHLVMIDFGDVRAFTMG